MWPAIGRLQDPDGGSNLGTVSELSIRVDDGEAYRVSGTMRIKGYGAGRYPDDATGGQYVITGGTGKFKGASGLMTSVFDFDTSLSVRTITFE